MTAEIAEIEEFEEFDNKSYSLYTLFSPLRKSIVLFGFDVSDLAETKFEKFSWFLHWISASLKVALLCLHLVCLLIRQSKLGFHIDSEMVWPMTETVWTVEALISIFYLIYWQRHNSIRNLAECLENATKQQGLRKSYKRLQLLMKICLSASGCFVVVILLSNAVSTFSTILKGYPSNKGIYFGVDSLNFLSLIAILYLSAGWCLTTALYGFLCKCLLTEFKNINDCFKLEQNLNKESMEKHLKMFSNLRFVVDKANNLFSTYIMLMLFCNIVVVVITLYAVLTSPSLGVGYIFVGSWLIASFIQIWALSWLPADVNDEAGQFGEAIYRKLSEENVVPTSELYVLASAFILRNINCPLGIQVGRFFYVTKALLLTIASLIISYLTLIIQSYPKTQVQQQVCNGTV